MSSIDMIPRLTNLIHQTNKQRQYDTTSTTTAELQMSRVASRLWHRMPHYIKLFWLPDYNKMIIFWKDQQYLLKVLNIRVHTYIDMYIHYIHTAHVYTYTWAPCDTSFKSRRIEISLLTYLLTYVCMCIQCVLRKNCNPTAWHLMIKQQNLNQFKQNWQKGMLNNLSVTTHNFIKNIWKLTDL